MSQDLTKPQLNLSIEAGKIYRQIRSTDYRTAEFTLWIVYKRRKQEVEGEEVDPGEDFRFAVRRLQTDKKLDQKLSGVVEKQVGSSRRLEAYSFEGSIEKDSALFEELTQTSFGELVAAIGAAGPNDVVSKPEHLHAAYGYMIQLRPKKGETLFAFRRVQSSWKAKRVLGLINAMLKENILVTAEEDRLFRFDERIDFFAIGQIVFILDKSGFESALNFRLGMERKRDELVAALEQTGLYSNLDLVRDLSKTHVRWLKKLAGAHVLGKCTDKSWVTQLLTCCEAKGWPVAQVGGKIEINADNCELVVRLMNYDLLESPVDQLIFKIDGAKEQF